MVELTEAVPTDAALVKVGMWHADFGFIETDRYDRLNKVGWDNVGFVPVFRVVTAEIADEAAATPEPGEALGALRDLERRLGDEARKLNQTAATTAWDQAQGIYGQAEGVELALSLVQEALRDAARSTAASCDAPAGGGSS